MARRTAPRIAGAKGAFRRAGCRNQMMMVANGRDSLHHRAQPVNFCQSVLASGEHGQSHPSKRGKELYRSSLFVKVLLQKPMLRVLLLHA